MFETAQDPIELLKTKLSALVTERANLLELIVTSGENVTAELGSDAYVDFGYTERLREVEDRIAKIEAELKDADDVEGMQRNLNI